MKHSIPWRLMKFIVGYPSTWSLFFISMLPGVLAAILFVIDTVNAYRFGVIAFAYWAAVLSLLLPEAWKMGKYDKD